MTTVKKKIVFLTFHNWKSKRQGGFHKLAEYACLKGYNTIFFSFPRPIWGLLRKSEVYNYKSIKNLIKGEYFDVGGNGNRILNITLLSFALPIPRKFYKYVYSSLLNFFERWTIRSFRKFAKKHFSNTDFFVFESTASVLFASIIKQLFPESSIVYRPSDPLMAFESELRYKTQEIQLLKMADIVFLVNKQGYDVYKKSIPDFDESVNFRILSNGVDLQLYRRKYDIPKELKNNNTALYIGARPIDWEMVYKAAQLATDINFVIVCPVMAPAFFLNGAKELNNLVFINGIGREDVPRWVTNAHVIVIPNFRDGYKTAPWGMTAKYYQAMAARKPIVAYHDSPEFKAFGIKITYSTADFIEAIRVSFMEREKEYPIILEEKEWNKICSSFFSEIENLKNA